jgi:hypothetical protein
VVTHRANVLFIYYYLLDWFYWVSKSGATTHTHTHTHTTYINTLYDKFLLLLLGIA